MKSLALVTLATFVVLNFGCSNKKTNKATVPEPQRKFGATIADSSVSFDEIESGQWVSSLEGTTRSVSAYDLLTLSNTLLSSKAVELKKKGKLISDLLAQPGMTATSINSESEPPGNPYAEQVYQYLHPVLIGKFKRALKQSRDVVEFTTQWIKQKAKEKSEQGGVIAYQNSTQALKSIIDKLILFNQGISQYKGSPASQGQPTTASSSNDDAALFLKGLSKIIQENYIKVLNDLSPKLTRRPSQNTENFLKDLLVGILTVPGLSEEDKKYCSLQLQEASYYASRVEGINEGADGFKLLIDMWFNRAARSQMPAPIVQFFNSFTEKQILALVTKNSAVMSDEDFTEIQNLQDQSNLTNKELVAILAGNKPIMEEKDWNSFLNSAPVLGINDFVSSTSVVDWMWQNKLNQNASYQDRFNQIVFQWLNLKFRFSLPKKLIQALSKYDSNEIEKMRDLSTGALLISMSPMQGAIRYMVTDTIESYPSGGEKAKDPQTGIRNFQEALNQKIISAVDAALKSRILALSEVLPDILLKEVTFQLEKVEPQFQERAFEFFKKYAKSSVDEWFLNGKIGPLHTIENLKFERVSAKGWQVKGDLSETTSSTLGANLVNNFYVIDSAEALNLSKFETSNWIFRSLGQLASIAGYKSYKNTFISSLTLPFSSQLVRQPFDINMASKYDPSLGLYLVPDKVKLKGNYEADLEKSLLNQRITPTGQMELLAGYLKAMNYLQPWTKSTFDTHIGNLKIENIDEEVFPKKTLFKQALGLAIVNLNNIPQAFLSLVGADNKIYGPDKEKGVIGAILTSSERGVKSEVVGTSEMAKAINILSEFYHLSRDFYKFDDLETKSNISKIICDRDDPVLDKNVNQLCSGDTKASARQKVHLLLTGLILFSTSKLMAPDGGFYSKVHTRNWKPVTEERYLEDQLEMQQALLNAGTAFKSDAILFRAVDNFFFLKKNFWNSKLGFFNRSEHTPQAVVRISQIIKARNSTLGLRDLVKGFVEQKPELESSVTQMSKMISIWDRYLQDLVSENFEPIELLHDLRLQSVSSF